ncbi:vesicular glutamate transporter 2-like [Schistocerca gregaria]|uniref:vesicular glutamate transporter 2-like n=1 Tax=Schistocerca gregaria TaxID=7010 RepID=UPI00211DA62D|nr:vesicular glutamate transporter 2-like [Schistocerca gregaria]
MAHHSIPDPTQCHVHSTKNNLGILPVPSKKKRCSGREWIADCAAARLSAGNVLWLLALCGFALNYAVRVNLNIAIEAMDGRYDWNEHQQALVHAGNGLAIDALYDGELGAAQRQSKFISAYLCSSVGAALTFPVSGALIGWLGWPAIFYATTLAPIVWFLDRWLLVFDHPHHHPRFSYSELRYLQVRLVGDAASYKPATPWGRVLTSRQVWLLVLAKWGSFWVLSTLLTQAPTCLRNIHGWSIGMVGLFSGIPHIGRTAFALLVSRVGDFLLKKEIISRPYLRKVATSSSLLVGLSYSGCSHGAATAFLVAAVSVNGALATGPLVALVDISPSFCNILLGLNNVVSTLPGFISPAVVGALTYQNQTPAQWRAVFLISAAMAAVPGAVYAVLGDAMLQPWDQPPAPLADAEGSREVTPLQPGGPEGGHSRLADPLCEAGHWRRAADSSTQ